MVIGAVIVTYRRPDVLVGTLEAVARQTAAIEHIVVVDNDAAEELRDRLSRDFPHVTYLPMPENAGYGAGLARGMRWLADAANPDWYWLHDDDSPPAPGELAEALDVALRGDEPAVVANRGGHLSWGRIRHDLRSVAFPTRADFTLVDGALVSKAAVAAAGFPREDLFMMHEDLDYTTRIAVAGGLLLVRPCQSAAMHLGSQSSWRVYYQSRNHLRIAIERRSIALVWGWLYRISALSISDLRRRRWRSLALRWRGALDGARGRMGRTVEP